MGFSGWVRRLADGVEGGRHVKRDGDWLGVSDGFEVVQIGFRGSGPVGRSARLELQLPDLGFVAWSSRVSGERGMRDEGSDESGGLFGAALGVRRPWYVERMEFDASARRGWFRWRRGYRWRWWLGWLGSTTRVFGV